MDRFDYKFSLFDGPPHSKFQDFENSKWIEEYKNYKPTFEGDLQGVLDFLIKSDTETLSKSMTMTIAPSSVDLNRSVDRKVYLTTEGKYLTTEGKRLVAYREQAEISGNADVLGNPIEYGMFLKLTASFEDGGELRTDILFWGMVVSHEFDDTSKTATVRLVDLGHLATQELAHDYLQGNPNGWRVDTIARDNTRTEGEVQNIVNFDRWEVFFADPLKIVHYLLVQNPFISEGEVEYYNEADRLDLNKDWSEATDIVGKSSANFEIAGNKIADVFTKCLNYVNPQYILRTVYDDNDPKGIKLNITQMLTGNDFRFSKGVDRVLENGIEVIREKIDIDGSEAVQDVNYASAPAGKLLLVDIDATSPGPPFTTGQYATIYNNLMYIGDQANQRIVAFTLTGQYSPSNNIQLNSANSRIDGIEVVEIDGGVDEMWVAQTINVTFHRYSLADKSYLGSRGSRFLRSLGISGIARYQDHMYATRTIGFRQFKISDGQPLTPSITVNIREQNAGAVGLIDTLTDGTTTHTGILYVRQPTVGDPVTRIFGVLLGGNRGRAFPGINLAVEQGVSISGLASNSNAWYIYDSTNGQIRVYIKNGLANPVFSKSYDISIEGKSSDFTKDHLVVEYRPEYREVKDDDGDVTGYEISKGSEYIPRIAVRQQGTLKTGMNDKGEEVFAPDRPTFIDKYGNLRKIWYAKPYFQSHNATKPIEKFEPMTDAQLKAEGFTDKEIEARKQLIELRGKQDQVITELATNKYISSSSPLNVGEVEVVSSAQINHFNYRLGEVVGFSGFDQAVNSVRARIVGIKISRDKTILTLEKPITTITNRLQSLLNDLRNGNDL